MKERKMVWLIASCLMAVTLLLASCGPAAVEEEVVPGEEEEEVVPVTEEEEEVVAEEGKEKEIVVDALGKLVEKPQYGGTLTGLMGTNIKTFEVLQAGSLCNINWSFVYESLGSGDWTRGPAGTNESPFLSRGSTSSEFWTGGLAESWEWTDPDTIVFHLRKGIHWQNVPPVNGREFTADDVVFSYNRALDNPKTEWKKFSDYIESIRAIDKYTVETKILLQDYGTVGTVTGHSSYEWIYTPEMVEAGGGTIEDWRLACGTGPFMADDFIVDSSITLLRNPNYWKDDELHPGNQLPYVDKVVLLYIQDAATRLAAIRTNKLDIRSGLKPTDVTSLKQTNPEITFKRDIYQVANPRIYFGHNQEPVSDVRVRRALHMAIDWDTIIRDFLGGEGLKASTPINAGWGDDVYTPFEELSPSAQEIWEYNPEKAKQLLAEAGYPNGFKTTLTTPSGYIEKMEIFQAYWKNIGIDCDFNVVERGALLSELYGKKIKQMVACIAGQVSPEYTLLSKATDRSLGKFSDPYFDEQAELIRNTVDNAERAKLCKELGVYWQEKVICLDWPIEYLYAAWQPWVKNYHGEVWMGSYYSDGQVYARIWIDQDLKFQVAGTRD